MPEIDLDIVYYWRHHIQERCFGVADSLIKRIDLVKVVHWYGGIRKEENRPRRSVGLTWWNLKRRESTRSKCWFDMVESQKKRIDRVEVVLRHGENRKEENRPG
ncbi:hypothetical protein BSG1_10503 [Bacillus sp. SG-1]|nr:hypothetical protein BSG1_10503 [Bacillus sp. SG-1]